MKLPTFVLAVLAALLLWALPAHCATRSVGPGRTYATVAAAMVGIGSGDSLVVYPAIYAQDWVLITQTNLKCVAWSMIQYIANPTADTTCTTGNCTFPLRDRPVFDAQAVQPAQGGGEGNKAQWVISAAGTEVRGMCFINHTAGSATNISAFRLVGTISGTVTLEWNYIGNGQSGILGRATTYNINYNEITKCGGNGGQSHEIYVDAGSGVTLTCKGNYLHDANVGSGHLLKSRAATNYILANRIIEGSTGTNDYSVDIPEHGLTYLIGNVIEQGPNTTNNHIVRYGAENVNNSGTNEHHLYAFNNTIINDHVPGSDERFIMASGGAAAGDIVLTAKNNIWYGPHGSGAPNTPTASAGSSVLSNNLQENPQTNTVKFLSPGSRDFHLTAASPSTVIDAGIAPGTNDGFDCTPNLEYVAPVGTKTRTLSGTANDLGAFEWQQSGGGGGGGDPCTP